MVRIEERKEITKNKAVQRANLPSKVYIPLIQHTGKECLPVIKIGDEVKTGQMIATREDGIFSLIHSSVSGKVIDITDWPHPLLGRAKAIVIESDGTDSLQFTVNSQQKDIERLTAEEIRKIIFSAGIVGLGGASFPTHIKLNPPKPVDTLIVNGAECEPYLTGDYRLMVEKTPEIIKGIELVRKCLGIKRVIVAIEDNKPQAIEQFKVHNLQQFIVKILKSSYPQGGEKQLIKNILGKEVPSRKLPFDVGVVVHNVATVFAIYEAIYLNKSLYERVVTITGSCIANPKNLLVRIGTPIKELIDFCGLKEEPAKIIFGGPMMGIAQFTDEIPVIKSTTGIILFTARETQRQEEEFCIRCGACVRGCPVGLMPCLINLASERGFWQKTKTYGAMDCIECGLCNYVCPAKRRLVQSIKRAKLEVAK